MKHCKLLSIVLAKTVFQLCGMDTPSTLLSTNKCIRQTMAGSVGFYGFYPISMDTLNKTLLNKTPLNILDELCKANKRLENIEHKIEVTANSSPEYNRLIDIPDIGLITASGLIAQVGDAKQFASSRGFAAWLGLTPKHEASSNKIFNQDMSKRSDRYLRTLLIHDGRIVLSTYKQNCSLKRFCQAS